MKARTKEYLKWTKDKGIWIAGGAIVGGVILPPMYRAIVPSAPWITTGPACLQDNTVIVSFVGAGIFGAIAAGLWKSNKFIATTCGGLSLGQLIYALGKCFVPQYFPYGASQARASTARYASARPAMARTASMAPLTNTGIPPAKVLA